MRPEFAYEINGVTRVVYLWASKTPSLTKQGVGASMQLLKNGLAKGKFSDAEFCLLNLRKKSLLSDALITNQSQILASSDIAGINHLWKSLG